MNPKRCGAAWKRRVGIGGLVAPMLVLWSLTLVAQEGSWPQFLGAARTGISSETNLLDAWPAGGPKILWRAAAGVGMSGLAIEDGTVVTMFQTPEQQWVLALDAASGDERWRTAVAPAYENGMGDGPRATPCIAEGRVFVFTGEGILAALRLADGDILWSLDAVEQLGGEPADYGMASSPLVVGERVIVTVGAPDAAVAAFSVADGALQWKAGNASAGYSSPALLSLDGGPQLLAFTGSAVLALDPNDGRVLWTYPFETDFDCNIATPIRFEDNVFISAGENHGCVMLAVKQSGDGYQVQPVWESLGPGAVMRNEWQTSILLEGRLYGLDNVGSAGPVTHLACVDAASGEAVWRKTRFGKGNLIAADGKLFLSTIKGELVVVKASPDGYDELGRMPVTGKTRQAPALAGGRLYLRDDKEIVCVDIRQR